MYLKFISDLKEIGTLSLPEFNMNIGLFEHDDNKISLIDKNVTTDSNGGFVGFSEMCSYPNKIALSEKIKNLFRVRAPLALFYNYEFIEDKSALSIVEMLLLLNDAGFYLTLPDFLNKCCYNKENSNDFTSLDMLFDYSEPTQEEKNKLKVEVTNKTLELFKSLVLTHISLETKAGQYKKDIISSDATYAVENIPLFISKLTDDEANLYALYCMIDKPVNSDINYISRYSYLKEFGALNSEVMFKLGFDRACIDNMFSTYKIHKDYFRLKATTESPLLVYLDPYKNESNCLLSMENELMAWKCYTELMQKQRDYVYDIYEPEDKG
jgi:hypothetical protein